MLYKNSLTLHKFENSQVGRKNTNMTDPWKNDFTRSISHSPYGGIINSIGQFNIT